jgi:hypothetical protein
VNLTHGGWLAAASDGAYADGLAGLIRVGPFGAVPAASKLVSVRLLEPVPRGEVMVLPLRWEATGVTGRLFPVLDADLTMTPAGAGQTLLTLNGAYRPPLGGIGAGLDRVVLRRAAAATIGSLLTRIADALASRAPAPGSAARPAGSQRAQDPDNPHPASPSWRHGRSPGALHRPRQPDGDTQAGQGRRSQRLGEPMPRH